MDHTSLQDTQQSKGSVLRHWEHSGEPVDKKAPDSSMLPTQDEKRPIRRVRSPSRPRAWLSHSYKPKLGGRFYKSHFHRDDHSFYKPGSNYHRHQPFNYFHRKDYHRPKLHYFALTEKDKEWYESRESNDGSPPEQSNSNRPFSHRLSSSRDKDKQFTVSSQSDRSQSRETDHRGRKSKERERSRDGELPSAAIQTMARDRAIQQKRREIDEVYYQECEMFGLVVKMLIEKDPSLEGPIQSSLQKNLRDIGARCVEAMEKFIEEYDSREMSQ